MAGCTFCVGTQSSQTAAVLIPLLQEQQGHWQEALQQLQDGSSSAGAAAGGSKGLSPMQLSEQLQKLYQQLLALPDPLPALRDAAALTAKTQGRVVGPFIVTNW